MSVTAPRWRSRIVDRGEAAPADLIANPRNWRGHPPAQRDALAGLLDQVGWVQDVVVNRRTGHLVDGHLRVELAKSRGEATVPVVYVDLSEEEEALVLVSLDPLAAMATADPNKLAALLGDAKANDEALRAMLTQLGSRAGAAAAGLTDPDAVPEPPAVPVTQPGDLWLLGPHRLLCGDSTRAEDVARVMRDDRAGLMNTDPPYGVSYANEERPNPGVAKPRVAKPRVANDARQDEELQLFLESAFHVAVAHALKKDAAWYLWHAHLTQGYFAAAAAAAADVILHRQIIWVKPILLLGRGQYHWKHEPCFMGWVRGNQPPDYGLGGGERTQTTVWEIGSVTQAERREFNHATPKPAGLFTIPLIKHLNRGECAFEPFAGSGPQFIAAEQTERICHGLEIDPRYCDVIVRRWEEFTGRKAERVAAEVPA